MELAGREGTVNQPPCTGPECANRPVTRRIRGLILARHRPPWPGEPRVRVVEVLVDVVVFGEARIQCAKPHVPAVAVADQRPALQLVAQEPLHVRRKGALRLQVRRALRPVLIHKRNPGERRILRQGNAGVGIDMPQPGPGELPKVRPGQLVRAHQGLEFVRRNRTFAHDAEGFPRNLARNEQVGGDVEAGLLQLGDETIEPIKPDGIQARAVFALPRQTAVMMVEPHGIVAGGGESTHQLAPVLLGLRETGAEAEVRAVKALRHPLLSLELEMVADGHEPPGPASRRRPCGEMAEVQRRTGLDGRRRIERQPGREQHWEQTGHQ